MTLDVFYVRNPQELAALMKRIEELILANMDISTENLGNVQIRLCARNRHDSTDYLYDRFKAAAVQLMGDYCDEAQTLLHLLTDNQLYGDELIFAIQSAEHYLENKGAK